MVAVLQSAERERSGVRARLEWMAIVVLFGLGLTVLLWIGDRLNDRY